MDLKQLKLTAITALTGITVGYFLLPHKTKIETKEVVKTVIQEVVKVQTNVKTKTVTVKVPGGTETTMTETEDTSVSDTALNLTQNVTKEKIASQNGVSIGFYALSDIHLTKPDYGVLIDIPVASKVSFFTTVDTVKRIAAGIKIQF